MLLFFVKSLTPLLDQFGFVGALTLNFVDSLLLSGLYLMPNFAQQVIVVAMVEHDTFAWPVARLTVD